MPTIKKSEDMEVWQIPQELTYQIYNFTHNEMFSRDFGLCNQRRRASVSIIPNVAEGFESRVKVLFKGYLGRAKVSAGELRAQVYVVKDIGYQ
jgi:four helix bundle protein